MLTVQRHDIVDCPANCISSGAGHVRGGVQKLPTTRNKRFAPFLTRSPSSSGMTLTLVGVAHPLFPLWSRLTPNWRRDTLTSMDLARAQESLKAADLCFHYRAHSSSQSLPCPVSGLPFIRPGVRQAADYGRSGVSRKVAPRLGRRAATFLSAVEEATHRGSTF